MTKQVSMKFKAGDEIVILASNQSLYSKGQLGIVVDTEDKDFCFVKLHGIESTRFDKVYVCYYKLELSSLYNSPLYQALL